MVNLEQGRDIGVWLHMYQPPRWANLYPYNLVSTDPEGIDHTARIYAETYRDFAKLGLFNLVSFDAYYSLRRELEVIDSAAKQDINYDGISVIDSLKQADGGIGDCAIHAILPDLHPIDKRVLIGAGKQLFTGFYGHEPRFFWPPESALDTDTLEALTEYGYEGVVVAPWQLDREDHRPIDGTPLSIALPSGRSIAAVPFDERLSMALAFNDKSDARKFGQSIFWPANNYFNQIGIKPQFGFTDLETFGEHWKLGQYFLASLLKNALPEMGIGLAKINDIHVNGSVPGKVWERSAWSCKCGGLRRWSEGNCSCHGGDTRWISPYYRTFANHLDGVRETVMDYFGMQDNPEAFIEAMLQRFEPSYLLARPEDAGMDVSVAGAYVAALAARTSCATFFDTIGTSGWINVLFGYVSMAHLVNAGMHKDVEPLKVQFEEGLKQVTEAGTTDVNLHSRTMHILEMA